MLVITSGALNLFDYFINKLNKALDCINHVIYTCVIGVCHPHNCSLLG